jgi:hypothetical protein
MDFSRHVDDDEALRKHSQSSSTEETTTMDNSMSSINEEVMPSDSFHGGKAMETSSHEGGHNSITMIHTNFHTSLDFDRHIMASPRRRVGGGGVPRTAPISSMEDSELGESFALCEDDVDHGDFANAGHHSFQGVRLSQLQANVNNLVTVIDLEDEEDVDDE